MMQFSVYPQQDESGRKGRGQHAIRRCHWPVLCHERKRNITPSVTGLEKGREWLLAGHHHLAARLSCPPFCHIISTSPTTQQPDVPTDIHSFALLSMEGCIERHCLSQQRGTGWPPRNVAWSDWKRNMNWTRAASKMEYVLRTRLGMFLFR